MTAKTDIRNSKSKSRALKGTRLELTLAAEQVFAVKGLQGATLREIREQAGQRNESVIHYHFGSREAIVESVLQLRSAPVDARRTEMLDQARAASNGMPLSTEQISRCCLMPLAELLLDGSSPPGHYMRFLIQLRVDRAVWRQFRGLYGLGLEACLAALRNCKPYMPVQIVDQRFISVMDMQVNGLAALEQIQHAQGSAFRYDDARVRIEDLIATGAAMFDAPLSPAVLAALDKSTEQVRKDEGGG
ncbi:MAG: helix-turn-helix domain-containing protein [Alloalcanivorax venustensis]|uniref:TetR/AcrR family transcriptional regulator n=1 Tax=Alloalcanivorax venustensis TaxID=172371 RepID=UPI003299BEE2